MADWDLHDGKVQAGPFDEAHVVRMIDAGLPSETVARPVGQSAWQNLRAHAPFAMALERRAAVPPPAAPLAPTTPSAGGEIVFVDEPGVKITNVRAIIRGATYPLANITSVRTFEESRPITALMFALVLTLAAPIALFNNAVGPGMVLIALALVMAYVHFYGMTDTYWVRIGTAGTESNAVSYTNRERANKIVDALNQAIVHRG